MSVDDAMMAKLDELVETIGKYPDPRRASTEWKQVFNLLKKTDANANHVANIVAMRGLDRLRELLDELRPGEAAADAEPDPNAPDDATCKAALKAFKKRLKLMRLDEESQIQKRDPLSKGAASEIMAIIPPTEWPAAVWAELVRRGKLRHTGRGFYELMPGA